MSDSNTNLSRRKLLATTGIGIATALAGCNQLGGDSSDSPNGTDTDDTDVTPSSFSYADGFSEDGIELQTALGQESAMAGLDSVSLEMNRVFETSQQTQELTQTGAYNQAEDTFHSQAETTSGGQTSTQETVYSNGTLYIRRPPAQESSETQFLEYDYQFQPLQEYQLSQLSQYMMGISLSADRVETQNGQTVAVYTADETAVTQDSLFANASEQGDFGSINTGTVEIIVDEQGRIHTADFEFEFATENGNTSTFTMTFAYTDFNSTTISEPDWVSEATFEDMTTTPEANVSFTETDAGDDIVVTVSNVTNADSIDVVVNNSVADTFGGPFDGQYQTTITASQYTTSDGSTATIAVYGYKSEAQQPTELETYTPETPANTTSENETNTTQ